MRRDSTTADTGDGQGNGRRPGCADRIVRVAAIILAARVVLLVVAAVNLDQAVSDDSAATSVATVANRDCGGHVNSTSNPNPDGNAGRRIDSRPNVIPGTDSHVGTSGDANFHTDVGPDGNTYIDAGAYATPHADAESNSCSSTNICPTPHAEADTDSPACSSAHAHAHADARANANSHTAKVDLSRRDRL